MNTDEISEIIKAGTERVFRNDTVLCEYLKCASRFYFMPVNNIILIHEQFPDAKKIASEKIWNKNNIAVPRGQEGIAILLNDTVIHENTIRLTERCVKVFDVAQTGGEDISEQKSSSYVYEILKNTHPTAETLLPSGSRGEIKGGVICIKSAQSAEEKIINWLRMYFQYNIFSENEKDAEYNNFLAGCCTFSVISVLDTENIRLYNPYTDGNTAVLEDIQRYLCGFWSKFYVYENGSHTAFDFFECNIINRNMRSAERQEFINRIGLLKNTNSGYKKRLERLEYKIRLIPDGFFKSLYDSVKNKSIISTNGYLCPEYESI